METEKSKSNQPYENQPETGESGHRTRFNCCGPWKSEVDPRGTYGPCSSFFKGSRTSIIVPFAVMGLLFTLMFAGWVLGVMAFLRVM